MRLLLSTFIRQPVDFDFDFERLHLRIETARPCCLARYLPRPYTEMSSVLGGPEDISNDELAFKEDEAAKAITEVCCVCALLALLGFHDSFPFAGASDHRKRVTWATVL